MKNTFKKICKVTKENNTILVSIAALAIALYLKVCLEGVLWAAEGGRAIADTFGLTDVQITAVALVGTLATTCGTIKAMSFWFGQMFEQKAARPLAMVTMAVTIALILLSTTFALSMFIFLPMNIVLVYATYMLEATE